MTMSLFHRGYAAWISRAWMALASCPARQGRRRSLQRIRQFLSRAFALSPGARSFAWARFASFCNSGLFFPRYGICACVLPRYPLASVTSPAASSSCRTPQAPLGFLVVHRAGQRTGDPEDLATGAGDDQQVHPVALVLAGVERPVRRDPVNRDERAAQDHIGVPGLLRVPHRLAQLRGAGPRADRLSRSRTARPWPSRPRTRPPARRTSRLCAGRPRRGGPAAQGSASAAQTRSRPGGGGRFPPPRS